MHFVGISPVFLLTLTFVALKLTGTIAWSWFWVLSPVIFTATLILTLFAIIRWFGAKLRGSR